MNRPPLQPPRPNVIPYDPGRAVGERRKDSILQSLAARRGAIVNRGRWVLLLRALNVGAATADDVRANVSVPDDVDPRCLGSVPGPLARAGIIRLAHFAKSNRPERHASYIGQWELSDANAALDWLRLHPDQPDPPPDDDADGMAPDLFTPPLPQTRNPAAVTTGLR